MSDDEDPRLTELDLRMLSITEDENGVLHLNHDGMDEPRALWLLESARHLLMDGYWYENEEGEDDDDD